MTSEEILLVVSCSRHGSRESVAITIKPAVNAVVTFTPQEFSWLLTLVAGNQLGACHFSFGEPVRGKAFIYSLFFNKALSPAEER